MTQPDVGTSLAVERTRLAYERTMMAWVRTATSLISFGFTIYKFFQLQLEGKAPLAHRSLIGPREFALLMIGTGLAALVLSSIQHWHGVQTLRATYGRAPFSVAGAVAALVGLLGIVAFGSVIFRQ